MANIYTLAQNKNAKMKIFQRTANITQNIITFYDEKVVFNTENVEMELFQTGRQIF